jgi:hypothetical protein
MTEIITEGWPDEGKNQVLLEEITCKYVQEADCTEDRDEPQEIILSSRDGGGGKFINIQTKSWSITGVDFEKEIIPLLRDFKHRMDDVFNNSGLSREEVLETSNS